MSETTTESGSGLRSAAGFVYLLAVVSLVAGVVLAFVLYRHTGCVVNPYNASLCMSTTHPWAGAAVGAGVGGAVQCFVLCVVARVAQVVADLRERA